MPENFAFLQSSLLDIGESDAFLGIFLGENLVRRAAHSLFRSLLPWRLLVFLGERITWACDLLLTGSL
jgi:hypothetical protein